MGTTPAELRQHLLWEEHVTGPLRDYRDWKALGPGGLPANGLGWLVTTALRLLKRDPLAISLGSLPEADNWQPHPRRGDRPLIGRHPVPHRQVEQLPSAAMCERTAGLVRALAAADPDKLRLARSRLERRGEALFTTGSPDVPWLRRTRGEIAHVHASDGSLHVVLHPRDAVALIAARRGERHPLSGVAGLGLPVNYLLLYAPRDDEELMVADQALRRAVAWAGARIDAA